MSFPHHPFSGFRLTPKNVNSGKIVLPLSQTTSVMAAAKWLGLTFKQEERWERDVNLQHISVPLNAVSSNTLLVFLPVTLSYFWRNNLLSKKHRSQHTDHHNCSLRENPPSISEH